MSTQPLDRTFLLRNTSDLYRSPTDILRMAGTTNGKPKRSAPSPSGRAKKKSKGDAIYDDPDAVLENDKSPLYHEETDLMVYIRI